MSSSIDCQIIPFCLMVWILSKKPWRWESDVNVHWGLIPPWPLYQAAQFVHLTVTPVLGVTGWNLIYNLLVKGLYHQKQKVSFPNLFTHCIYSFFFFLNKKPSVHFLCNPAIVLLGNYPSEFCLQLIQECCIY